MSDVTELVTPLSDVREHSSAVVNDDREPETLTVSVSDHDALREEQLADDSLKNVGHGQTSVKVISTLETVFYITRTTF